MVRASLKTGITIDSFIIRSKARVAGSAHPISPTNRLSQASSSTYCGSAATNSSTLALNHRSPIQGQLRVKIPHGAGINVLAVADGQSHRKAELREDTRWNAQLPKTDQSLDLPDHSTFTLA